MSYASDAAIAFAMHADTSNLSWEEGLALAELIADEVAEAAEDRRHIPGIRFDQGSDDER